MCCLQETHLSSKEKHRLRVKGWKMILQPNDNQKKVNVAIILSDKIDFKPKKTRDRDGHYIMIKGIIHQEDITFININAPTVGAPKYIKQLLKDLKGEIDSNTIRVGDVNTPLTSMDRSSRQQVNKEISVLNETLDQIDLIGLYRTFPPKAAEYMFFLSANGNSQRQMIYWETRQASTYLRLKLHQVFVQTQRYEPRNALHEKSWESHKYVENK